jgi:subfamily B ATP-binding cassette protein MsbA
MIPFRRAPAYLLGYFRLFQQLTGNRLLPLTALNIITGYSEGIGIALFYPLLRGQSDPDRLSSSLARVLQYLHVPATPTGALPFLVLAFLVKGALVMASYTYQERLASQVGLSLRRELMDGLRRADYRAVLQSNSATLASLVVHEVSSVRLGFVFFARTLPPLVNIATFSVIVFWLHWQLTALCGVMGLAALLMLRTAGRATRSMSRRATAETEGLASLLVQIGQAFKYLRTTAGFGPLSSRVTSAAERLADAEYRSGRGGNLTQAISQPLSVLFLSALVYYRAAIRHEELGALFVLMLYFYRIMNEIWNLQIWWQNFLRTSASVDAVRSSLDSFRSNAEPTGAQPFAGIQQEIRLDGVSFGYEPDRKVLHGIDLRIPRNATVALVGESGSGKSTLVDLILGTLRPESGGISIDGTALSQFDLESLRRRVGYVPQDAMLFDDTVRNNIALWTDASEGAILDAARRARCLEFIEAMPLKLETRLGERGLRLSGGQRQRLAIARELLKNPDILVLDEATSSLDSESERAIQRSIDGLAGQLTLIIIAHRFSTIRNCSHICVLKEGRIVERGTYDELMGQPGSRFRRMADMQRLSQEPADQQAQRATA